VGLLLLLPPPPPPSIPLTPEQAITRRLNPILIGLINDKGIRVSLDVPLLRQGENRCGPTSLAMALAYHGHNVNPHGIMGNVGSGVTGHEIAAAAEAEGFQADYVSGDGDLEKMFALLDKGVPLIINALVKFTVKVKVGIFTFKHTYSGYHFVVVTGYDRKTGQIFVNDPAQGTRVKKYGFTGKVSAPTSYSFSEFKSRWGARDYGMIAIAPEGSAKAEAIRDILNVK